MSKKKAKEKALRREFRKNEEATLRKQRIEEEKEEFQLISQLYQERSKVIYQNQLEQKTKDLLSQWTNEIAQLNLGVPAPLALAVCKESLAELPKDNQDVFVEIAVKTSTLRLESKEVDALVKANSTKFKNGSSKINTEQIQTSARDLAAWVLEDACYLVSKVNDSIFGKLLPEEIFTAMRIYTYRLGYKNYLSKYKPNKFEYRYKEAFSGKYNYSKGAFDKTFNPIPTKKQYQHLTKALSFMGDIESAQKYKCLPKKRMN